MQTSATFLRSRRASPRGGATPFFLFAVDRAARRLAAAGVSANAVTGGALAIGIAGGVLLAFGWFGWATLAVVVASLGDALDGALARQTRTASDGGALLDASADRYEEFAWLAGLAVCFHRQLPVLVVVLFALLGSFMVSYGSAKAEALGVPVPPGIMRRAERAVCLCSGIGFTAVTTTVAATADWPDWARHAPLFASLGIVAVLANVSAIARLRRIATFSR